MLDVRAYHGGNSSFVSFNDLVVTPGFGEGPYQVMQRLGLNPDSIRDRVLFVRANEHSLRFPYGRKAVNFGSPSFWHRVEVRSGECYSLRHGVVPRPGEGPYQVMQRLGLNVDSVYDRQRFVEVNRNSLRFPYGQVDFYSSNFWHHVAVRSDRQYFA